jgi:hypothetical protein
MKNRDALDLEAVMDGEANDDSRDDDDPGLGDLDDEDLEEEEEELEEEEEVDDDLYDLALRTGDTSRLPPKVRKLLEARGSENRELAELRGKVQQLEQRDAAPKDDDPMPEVPEKGTVAEIVAALDARTAWQIRRAMKPVDDIRSQAGLRAKTEQASVNIAAMPGASPEILQEAGRLLATDPEWQEVMFTSKGQKMLFNAAKANVGSDKNNSRDRAVGARSSRRIRSKTAKADLSQRIKKMSLSEIMQRGARGEFVKP